MITNSLVPCNGRFPTLIALISMFFVISGGLISSFASSAILAVLIVLSVIMTLLCSKLLSVTFLRGESSSFTLELPPYRTPNILKTLVRSMLDRTVYVLARSVAVAAPAGLILYLLANLEIGDISLLGYASDVFDPVGKILGMDGAILLAFILALPANEIFLPIVLMIYTSGSSLIEYSSLGELLSILVSNGWTTITAVSVVIFTLFHFPCSTTLMTIKKESGSWKWTALSAVLPTLIGALLCIVVSNLLRFVI